MTTDPLRKATDMADEMQMLAGAPDDNNQPQPTICSGCGKTLPTQVGVCVGDPAAQAKCPNRAAAMPDEEGEEQ